MAITVLPQFRNPWVESLPGYLQNMALEKMAHRFKAGELEKSRKFQEEQQKLRLEQQEDLFRRRQELQTGLHLDRQAFETSERIAEQKFKEKQGRGYLTVKGKDFYWVVNKQTGEMKKTPVPVAEKAALSLKDRKDLARYKHDLRGQLARLKTRLKGPRSLTPTDNRLIDTELVRMAMTIEDDPTGPAVKQATVFFNKYAKGNFVYLFKKTKRSFLGEKQEAIRVDLPMRNGRQVTAQDIRDTLRDNPGKTLEVILRDLGVVE
jgi:hypothetical protein